MMSHKLSLSSERGAFPLVPVVVVAIVVLGIVALIVTSGGGDAGTAAYGEVDVSGEPLPVHQGEMAADPALGRPTPTFEGQDMHGDPTAVDWEDGDPKLLVFLAHWCPHCQDEVPMITQVDEDGGVPDGVDVIGVATGTDPSRDEFPPGDWLDEEQWPFPVVMDDEDGTLSSTYGVHAFPYWVFVGGDGEVLARRAGAIGEQGFRSLVTNLAEQG